MDRDARKATSSRVFLFFFLHFIPRKRIQVVTGFLRAIWIDFAVAGTHLEESLDSMKRGKMEMMMLWVRRLHYYTTESRHFAIHSRFHRLLRLTER